MRDITDFVIEVAKQPGDLTFRQLAILMFCARETDGMNRQIHMLASRFGFAKPVVSRAGDRLVDLGYISRGVLPHDRRTCYLTVTKIGHRFIKAMTEEKPVRVRHQQSRVKGAAA